MKITFFIDATILKDESGFVTCSCLLDKSLTVFTEDSVGEYYAEGQLLLSSVPFDAVVSFNERDITYNEAVTTSIEQILIDSSINNLKRKLLDIDKGIEVDSLKYEIIYFDTIDRYVEVLEDSINENPDINIDIEMINSKNIDFKKCPGYDIPCIQNRKYLKDQLDSEGI